MVFNIAQFSKSSHGKIQAGQANRSILNWCLSLCKEIVVQIIFAKSIYMFYTWLCSSVLITFTPCTAPFQHVRANLLTWLSIWKYGFYFSSTMMTMMGKIRWACWDGSLQKCWIPEDLDVASNLGIWVSPRFGFGSWISTGCRPLQGFHRVNYGALEESMAVWRLDCHDFGTCV